MLKHSQRRNVTSYHSFSLLSLLWRIVTLIAFIWLFQFSIWTMLISLHFTAVTHSVGQQSFNTSVALRLANFANMSMRLSKSGTWSAWYLHCLHCLVVGLWKGILRKNILRKGFGRDIWMLAFQEHRSAVLIITQTDQFLVELGYSLGLGKGPKESGLLSVKGQKVCAPNWSRQAGQSSSIS